MKIVEPGETSALESAGLTVSSPWVLSSPSSSKTKLILFFIAYYNYIIRTRFHGVFLEIPTDYNDGDVMWSRNIIFLFDSCSS